MKIVLDAFGGDHAPQEIVKGGLESLGRASDFTLVLVGNREKIQAELLKYTYEAARVEIVEANEVITNDDVPTIAIRDKKDSSLVRAFDTLKNDKQVVGMVSAGSTGAVLTGGLFKLGRIRGISRPALAPILPTVTERPVALIDCGANVDCKPINLCHFALMGTCYMRSAFGVKEPRVALLSNGTEDKKGNELNREVFKLLKEMPNICFVGNMEARDILSGDYDVVVTDGFAGNVCLKSLEGTANMVFTLLKQEIDSSLRSKIGALLFKPSFKRMFKKMDYNKSGGALFLGVEKILVKAHGSSKSDSIASAILQVKRLHESGLVEDIKRDISAQVEIG